jgi:exodeoxyribonuclease VII small subunit
MCKLSGFPLQSISTQGAQGLVRDNKAPDFEEALAELESLVERLERGDLPLDEALKTFERGVELTRHCQSSLKAAQQKVEILLKRGSATSVEAFRPEDDSTTPPAVNG